MSRYSSGFITGLFLGAAAGTVIGLLYAPDKGINTRDRLSYRLSSYLEDLEDVVDRLKLEKEIIKSEAKERGNQVVSSAKQQADDLISEAEALINSIKAKHPEESTEEKG